MPWAFDRGSQPIHWLVMWLYDGMRAVGTREGYVVAYLKTRVFPHPFIPAIEMAGYPYYAPLGLGGSANSALRTKQGVKPVPKGRPTTGRGETPVTRGRGNKPRRGERAHLFVLSPRRGSCGVAVRCRGQDPCLWSVTPSGLHSFLFLFHCVL